LYLGGKEAANKAQRRFEYDDEEWAKRLATVRYLQSLVKVKRTQLSQTQLKAQKGDTISVHYTGRYPGGKVFDTSVEKEAINAGLFNKARDYKPLQVILGTGKVIAGFDEALIGMKVNEEKDVTIPPEKAYGKSGNHPMAGKTLQFKLRVTSIKRP
jgi:FKBP-type peptidyl-prolyl cis-trans isomerase